MIARDESFGVAPQINEHTVAIDALDDAGGPLADRNDLNGSPALGKRGVYIGGEHGRVWFVPYDYCRVDRDLRCSRSPGQEFSDDLNRVLTVTPGGTTRFGAENVPAATASGLSY